MVRRSDLRVILCVKVANKLINAIRFQPCSSSIGLVAVGSNEHTVKLVDIRQQTLSSECK